MLTADQFNQWRKTALIIAWAMGAVLLFFPLQVLIFGIGFEFYNIIPPRVVGLQPPEYGAYPGYFLGVVAVTVPPYILLAIAYRQIAAVLLPHDFHVLRRGIDTLAVLLQFIGVLIGANTWFGLVYPQRSTENMFVFRFNFFYYDLVLLLIGLVMLLIGFGCWRSRTIHRQVSGIFMFTGLVGAVLSIFAANPEVPITRNSLQAIFESLGMVVLGIYLYVITRTDDFTKTATIGD